MDIGEFAVEGRHGGASEEIGRDHPGQQLKIAKIAADGRQCGRNDRLIERGEKHRQHHPPDDAAHLEIGERPGGRYR